MSLLIDFLKNRKQKGFEAFFDITKEMIPYFESMIDLFEEAGLKESKEIKGNEIIFSFKYNDETWVSISIIKSHTKTDVQVMDKVLEEHSIVNSPCGGIILAYDYLKKHCVNNNEKGEALVSLGFMISGYMTYITKGKFRSKRITYRDMSNTENVGNITKKYKKRLVNVR